MRDIKIFAWNVQDGLSDEARREDVVDMVTEEFPDVAVLTEAYDARHLGRVASSIEAFARDGYMLTHVPQEREDDRPDQHGIALVTKEAFTESVRVVPLAGRYAIQALMRDAGTGKHYTVLGYHGNDKDEQRRLDDARALATYVQPEDGHDALPVVLAGDLNTMEPRAPIAQALGLTRPLTHLFPQIEYDPDNPQTGLLRTGSVARRLSDMAIGSAFRLYGAYGLEDADGEMIPTLVHHGIPVKLDHIMTTNHFNVHAHSVHIKGPGRIQAPRGQLSYHRAISARMSLREAARS